MGVSPRWEPPARVETRDRLPARVRTVAGVDAAYSPDGAVLCAAVAVLGLPDLRLLEVSRVVEPVPAPYRPGFLAEREAPALVRALGRLGSAPDVVLADAHGVAHPAGFGAACHVGLAAGVPTVGVAKSRLVGTHGPVPPARGAWVPLTLQGRTVGAVVRTREGVRPVYVSTGHRVSLETAVRLVLATCRFRLPDQVRAANREAREGLERAVAGGAPARGAGRRGP